MLRFSNVYAAPTIMPIEWCRRLRVQRCGRTLRVDGSSHVLTSPILPTRCAASGHDRSAGVWCGVAADSACDRAGTTLSQLADLAQKRAVGAAASSEAPARSYDVTQFVGSPQRARELLGFAATTSIAQGMAALIAAFRALSPKEKTGAGLGPNCAGRMTPFRW